MRSDSRLRRDRVCALPEGCRTPELTELGHWNGSCGMVNGPAERNWRDRRGNEAYGDKPRSRTTQPFGSGQSGGAIEAEREFIMADRQNETSISRSCSPSTGRTCRSYRRGAIDRARGLFGSGESGHGPIVAMPGQMAATGTTTSRKRISIRRPGIHWFARTARPDCRLRTRYRRRPWTERARHERDRARSRNAHPGLSAFATITRISRGGRGSSLRWQGCPSRRGRRAGDGRG